MQPRPIGSIVVLTTLLLCAGAAATPTGRQAAGPASVPAPAAAPNPVPPAALDAAALAGRVDALLNAHVAVNSFSGAVLMASAGKPLIAKGYGYANAEWQIPNTPQTKFRVGSITKQFTSVLVMQLREAGKLRLEDSICVYVAPCPDAWKPVTIHHLLTHTSGIPTYTGIPSWREANMVPKTVDQIVGIFRDLPLQWTPGERYAYNNSGYFLLGVVIEKASGRKYEEALQEMILTPLGMKDTGYDWSKTILLNRASGYSGRGDALANAAALDMQQPYAAGALYSTVEDLLRWDQALYTTKLLPDAAKQTMWTPFKDNYAYGWSVVAPSAATFGYRRISHTGGINGFSSVIIRVPDAEVTSIVLANNESANAGAIGRDLLAIYYGQPYNVPRLRTVASVDPATFDRLVGKYELNPGFVITVTREGDRLMAQATGQGKLEFFPESPTTFFAKAVDATIEFGTTDGKLSHLVLRQSGKDQRAKKIE